MTTTYKLQLMKMVFSTLLVFGALALSIAGEEVLYKRVSVTPGQSVGEFIFKDDKFETADWSLIDGPQQVRNMIAFEVDMDDQSVLPQGSGPVTLNVTYDLKYWDADGMLHTPTTDPLEFIYDPNTESSSAFRAFYTFQGAHKIQLENVVINSSQPNATPALNLYAEILINRLYNFDNSASPSFPTLNNFTHTVDFGQSIRPIQWDAMAGAESYDLEWVYYDSQSKLGKDLSAGQSVTISNALFKNNATRINSSAESHDIDLLYREGYLFYRIRGVRVNHDGIREHSAWSSIEYDRLGEREGDINWQSSIVFAEGGKNIPSVQYFDATMRSRQSVTKSNAIDETIIGETVYDHHGRPAMNILPVPSGESTIQFDKLFNRNITNTVIDASNFDEGDCGPLTSIVSTDYGASKYYSPRTGVSGRDSYIPDAEGFPYTITEFTPDLTGRIKRQSGVGKAFKLGGDHDTKYLYGKPTQEELDRLFGNDVGHADHYLKNAVIDPNGQVSLSYIDAHGRVIATALAGEVPEEAPGGAKIVSQIDSGFENPTVITSSILNNQIQGDALVSVYKLIVESPGNQSFNYSLQSDLFTDPCTDATICFECVYDLEITVSDNDCNLFNPDPGMEGMPFKREANNISLQDINCATSTIGSTFTLDLPIGEYTIVKKLLIDKETLDYYTEEYLNIDACVPTYATILDEELAEMDFASCETTCESCLENIGVDSDAFIASLRPEVEAGGGTLSDADGILIYNELKSQCEALCQPVSECDAIYELIVADLTPVEFSGNPNLPEGGQYAVYSIGIDGEYLPVPGDPTSIFYNNTYQSFNYLGSDGMPLIVTFIDNETGETLMKNPQDMTIKEFVLNWERSWSEQPDVLNHHPEYCKYQQWCEQTNFDAVDDWEQMVLGVSSLMDAIDKNLIDPVTGMFMDPLFDLYPACESELETLLEHIDVSDPNSPSVLDWVLGQAYQGGVTPDCDEHMMVRYDYGHELDSPDGPFRLVSWTIDGIVRTINAEFNNTDELAALMTAIDTYSAWENDFTNKKIRGIGNPVIYGDLYIVRIPSMSFRTFTIEGTYIPLCAEGLGAGSMIENDRAWDLYISIYLSYRQQVINNKRSANCDRYTCVGNEVMLCPGSQPNFYSDKIPRINRETRIVTGSPYTQAELDAHRDQAEADFINQCETDCAANADYWIEQIQDCIPGSTNITALKNRLIAVCQSGCDVEHPSGASSTPPGVSINGDTSFEQIIQSLNSGARCDIDCQITTMHPYERPIYRGPVYRETLDGSCACERIQNFETTYATEPEGADSFLDYLNSFSATYISEVDLMTLKMHCDEGGTGYLPRPMRISPILECKTETDGSVGIEECRPCTVVKFESNRLITLYGCDPNAPDYNDLVTNHINKTFGFQLSTSDLMEALARCDDTSIPTDAKVVCPTSPYLNPGAPIDVCTSSLTNQAMANARLRYENAVDEARAAFRAGYREKCLNVEDDEENFSATITSQEYHYTLYYYDQSGNLVQTVPPNGVQPLNPTEAAQMKAWRDNGTGSPIKPDHTFRTKYKYNSLNQITHQISPDTDLKEFWYDAIGRLVVSQDGRQRPLNRYSYTLYDNQGRIEEVGEKESATSMTDAIALGNDPTWTLANWINNNGDASSKSYVTSTFYDVAQSFSSRAFETNEQDNLRTRVAVVTIEDVYDENPETYDYASHYDYDVTGNVRTIIQENGRTTGNQKYKRIDYDYDYISGNVNAVYYQLGQPDQFTHQYAYDANNRLEKVYTSTIRTTAGEGAMITNVMDPSDAELPLWDTEAVYEYYDHGPLARAELGETKVQGMDYAYTLQGWIKGVNSSGLDPSRDIGRDGVAGDTPKVGRDVLGYTLGYYDGDYTQIGGSGMEMTVGTSSTLHSGGASLYNGNIRHMVIHNKALGDPMGYSYQYDQLHRIKDMTAHDNADLGTYAWGSTPNGLTKYSMAATYDGNGNIQTMRRTGLLAPGSDPQEINNLSYDYDEVQANQVRGTDGNNRLFSNVESAAPCATEINITTPITEGEVINASERITDNSTVNPDGDVVLFNAGQEIILQPGFHAKADQPDDLFRARIQDCPHDAEQGESYVYDGNGNMIQNESGASIEWTPYGKVAKVTKGNGAIVTYGYDPAQNRVYKKIVSGGIITQNHYVRDAQGNTMAVYEQASNLYSVDLWKEQYIYGSSRLGALRPDKNLFGQSNPVYTTAGLLEVGQKTYELSNHLGNVLAVVNDRKIGMDTNSDGDADYYEATVIHATDYYPFGMDMPSRSYTLNAGPDYRFGFNGKEKDANGEWGNHTHYDYGFRIYNPEIAKFLSVDPLTATYPMLTPYQFASNRPIDGIDLDGLEYLRSDEALIKVHSGGVFLKMENMSNVMRNRQRNATYITYFDSEINNQVIGTTFNSQVTSGRINILQMVESISIARDGFPGPITFEEVNLQLKTDYFRSFSKPLRSQRFIDYIDRSTALSKLPPAPISGKGTSIAALVVGGTSAILDYYANAHVSNDAGKVLYQYDNYYQSASLAVAFHSDVIPKKYRTEEYLEEITNFVLQGEFVKSHTEEVRDELLRAATLIILRVDEIPLRSAANEGLSKLREGIVNGKTDINVKTKDKNDKP